MIKRPIRLIDGNKAIARQTKNLLKKNSLENISDKKGKAVFFSTGDAEKFAKVASKLLDQKVSAEKVEL
mgnify:CR=1 FL=1